MRYHSESREDYDDGLDYEDPEYLDEPNKYLDECPDEPESRREKCSCSPQQGWDSGWHYRSCFKIRPETHDPHVTHRRFQ